MKIKDAEAKLGKVKEVHLSAIESREYAIFTRQPKHFTFEVERGTGIYPGKGEAPNQTRRYRKTRHISLISVSKYNWRVRYWAESSQNRLRNRKALVCFNRLKALTDHRPDGYWIWRTATLPLLAIHSIKPDRSSEKQDFRFQTTFLMLTCFNRLFVHLEYWIYAFRPYK